MLFYVCVCLCLCCRALHFTGPSKALATARGRLARLNFASPALRTKSTKPALYNRFIARDYSAPAGDALMDHILPLRFVLRVEGCFTPPTSQKPRGIIFLVVLFIHSKNKRHWNYCMG